MKIASTETRLTGAWVMLNGHVVSDDVTKRIEALVSTHLKRLGTDASGWDTLYRDPDDGRLWERIFPHSGWHGGGPPELRALTFEQAARKYGDRVVSS